MPLRSKLPFHMGVDITSIRRFKRHAYDPKSMQSFVNKIFTPREAAKFLSSDALPLQKVRFIASRWAAKEAVIKAVRHRRLFYKHVEIYSLPSKAVFALVLDEPRAALFPDTESVLMDSPAEATQADFDDRLSRGGDASSAVGEDLISAVDQAALHGREMGLTATPESLADEDGMLVEVTISHEVDYCVAVAMAAADEQSSASEVEQLRR